MMSSHNRFVRFRSILAARPPAIQLIPTLAPPPHLDPALVMLGIAIGDVSPGTFAPVDVAPTPEKVDHYQGWQSLNQPALNTSTGSLYSHKRREIMKLNRNLMLLAVSCAFASVASAGAVRESSDSMYKPTGKGWGELDLDTQSHPQKKLPR
ncbi:hypothetical protein ACFS07_04910 [Undibacterium arcticum]